MQYTRSLLVSPEGDVIWDGAHAALLEGIATRHLPERLRATLSGLAGAKVRTPSQPWLAQVELTREAERLGFISRKGCARGFVTSLAPFLLLERCLDTFNTLHLEKLGASEIQFPYVFSQSSNAIQDLTDGYQRDGRIFTLAGSVGEELRLSYAADPGFFGMIDGMRFPSSGLPFTVASPMQFFRRYKSGETGPLTRVRQYGITDVHSVVQERAARELCCLMIQFNREAMGFWVGEDVAQFIDLTPDFHGRYPSLAAEMARAARSWTIVNVFAEKPRYYSMRSGLVTDAGFGPLMLYNVQWDEENTDRFNFKTVDGEPLVVLHGNTLAASGLLCVLLGRALVGLSPQMIPPEVATVQVTLLPLRAEFCEAAKQHSRRLANDGWRTLVRAAERPGAAIRKAKEQWLPAVAVIGIREACEPSLRLQVPFDNIDLTEEQFANLYGGRSAMCRPWRCLPAAPLFL